jgi:hypothetical protein
MLALYVFKGPYNPNRRFQRVEQPFFQSSFKRNDNVDPFTFNGQIFEKLKYIYFKCKKVGHRIKDCIVQIAKENPNIIQSNLTTKHNSNDVGTCLYGVLCKKFHMSLLYDHSSRMVVLGPFQRQLKNNYIIFKPNYIITTSFIIVS